MLSDRDKKWAEDIGSMLGGMVGAAAASFPVFLLWHFHCPALALWLGVYLCLDKRGD